MLNRKQFSSLVAGLSFACVSSLSLAQSAAGTIADIVSGMNHFPNDGQKMTLQEIASDGSQSEAIQTVAQAVHDIQHSVSEGTRAELQAIAADDSVDADTRALAEVVAGFNHMASESDEMMLAEID